MLSSPPPASSYVSPATAGTSKQNKRLSLNGPRPLHLVEGSPVTGSSSSPASPFSPKLSLSRSGSDSPGPGTWSPKAAPSSFRDPDGNGIARNPRRQSSISYNTSQNSDKDSSAFSRSPLASSSNSPVPPTLSLKRSTSVGGRPNSWSGRSRPAESNAAHERTRSGWKRETFAGSITPTSSLEDGSSPSADEEKQDGGAQATTPLTLAEKHADLLHFIAQKESKCLDLRTQLATHEAELLQLKKKWERIVERSFSRTHPSSAYNPGLSSVNPTSTTTSDSGQSIHSSPLLSGTDNPSIPTTSGIAPSSLYTAASLSYLDSLVTNTGRLLGLPGLSTPTSPAIPSGTHTHTSDASAPPSSWKDLSEERTPRSGTFPQNSQTHTPALSYSSTTTTSSVSARLSQDGEGEDLSSNASRSRQSKRPNSKRPPRSPHSRPNDLLIVTDTGATPLCSPNSEFEAFFGKGRRPHSHPEDFGSSENENENENEDTWGDFQTANTDSQSQSLSRSNSLEINRSPSDLRPRRPKSKPQPPSSPGYDPDAAMGLGFAPPPSSSVSKDAEKERLAERRRKRMSLPVTGPSSNDETGSLASWMGLGSLSGGTKWDKFSGSIENALAKSPLPIPKRASILLSQLSQVPGLSQFSGVASTPIPETDSEPTSSRSKGDKKTKINLSTSSTSTSLLDEDVPPISSSSSLQPSLIPSRSTTPSGTGNKKATADDGDDEWNW
ncbi:hypothetical protein PQX77_004323 [Marasmius sp. AFHP31]|nr:hypothetical protein PQX77_004323 [Marasmius sp. AFHP31]